MLEWISNQEMVLDKFGPISSNVSQVADQLNETMKWSDLLINKHLQLESLNWMAGQLMMSNDQGVYNFIDDESELLIFFIIKYFRKNQ